MDARSQTNLYIQRAKILDACQRLTLVTTAVRALSNFSASENLVPVVQWLNILKGRTRYKVVSTGIEDLDWRKAMERPAGAHILDVEPLRRLERL